MSALRTSRTLAAASAMLVLTIMACSSGPGDDGSTELGSGAADGPLVLYTNDFEDIIGERFTADTGIEIEVVQEPGGNLLARIAAEGSNPQWDVALFDGLGSLHALGSEGLLRTGVEPTGLDGLTPQARELLPDDLAYVPVGTTASCVIVYRTDLVGDPPTTYEDLAEERLRGLAGQADPAVAAPAYPCVAWLHYDRGIDSAQGLYQDILDNDLRLFRTNGPTRQALEAGEIHAALLSSPQALGLVVDGEPVQVAWPDDGAPASSRGIAVSAGSERPEAASAFQEWMLDPATQQFLTDEAGRDGLFLASVNGVEPAPGSPAADRTYNIAPADWAAENEAAIKEWFADRAVN